MEKQSKTASLAGLTVPVVSKAVAAQTYQIRPEIATSEYAAIKLATRFRLSLSTSREICRLAGIGGAQ